MYKIYEQKRDALGLTNYQVAKATGISEATISLWKTSKRQPSLSSLSKLSKYFRCPITDFLED